MGRNTQGVKLVNLREGDSLVAIQKIEDGEEVDESDVGDDAPHVNGTETDAISPTWQPSDDVEGGDEANDDEELNDDEEAAIENEDENFDVDDDNDEHK